MPDKVYTIRDSLSGRTKKVRGDSPPTEEEAAALFADEAPETPVARMPAETPRTRIQAAQDRVLMQQLGSRDILPQSTVEGDPGYLDLLQRDPERYAQTMVGNLPASAGRTAVGALKAVPGILRLGALQMIGRPDFVGGAELGNAAIEGYKERYGGAENIARSVATDPVGVGLDVASLAGTGRLAAPGVVSGVRTVARPIAAIPPVVARGADAGLGLFRGPRRVVEGLMGQGPVSTASRVAGRVAGPEVPAAPPAAPGPPPAGPPPPAVPPVAPAGGSLIDQMIEAAVRKYREGTPEAAPPAPPPAVAPVVPGGMRVDIEGPTVVGGPEPPLPTRRPMTPEDSGAASGVGQAMLDEQRGRAPVHPLLEEQLGRLRGEHAEQLAAANAKAESLAEAIGYLVDNKVSPEALGQLNLGEFAGLGFRDLFDHARQLAKETGNERLIEALSRGSQRLHQTATKLGRPRTSTKKKAG